MPRQSPSVPPTATVIFMHGLGDSADGWLPALRGELAPALPHVRFVCPTAPQRPVSLNGGHRSTSWHDMTDLESIDSDTPHGLDEAVAAVHALIDAEVAGGIPAHRIVVAGFSQGAAMSLRTGFSYARGPLAGIMPLSGYLPGRQIFAKTMSAHAANLHTRLQAFHGSHDRVVQLAFARAALRTLRENGATFGAAVPAGAAAAASSDATLPIKVYPGMAHQTCEQEMDDVVAFLRQCLPPIEAVGADVGKSEL